MRRRSDALGSLVISVAGGVGLLVALAFGAWHLDGGPGWAPLPAPLPALSSASPPCQPGDELTWRHASGESIDPTAITLLATNAALSACAPSAGVLSLTLRGTVAENVGSRAVLVHGFERLLDVELRDEERAFMLDVPASGQLLLAFVNDRYVPPEDRNLWVSGLGFTPRAH